MNPCKRIAALTMVHNDAFFLRKWVEYYGGQFGKENLFVYFDGLDQEVPPCCEGCHVTLCNRFEGRVVKADKARVAFLSSRAAELFDKGYELVIGTDVDEFIACDPADGLSLAEFLSSRNISSGISPLGLDVGQRLGEEADLDENGKVLRQRAYAQIGPRYTKASVLARPLRWGSGFHRIKRHDYHICPDLYLFHLGYCDQKRLSLRFSDSDRIRQGQNRHMWKRSRVIRLCTGLPARNFDEWTRTARIIQTVLRPIYTPNKPSMGGLKIVVRIPERFRNLV